VPSRYLIGVDLGTTNSVVAYLDTQDADSGVRVFPIPQLVAHGEVRTLSSLPSFLYFPTADELSSGAVSATWDEDPPMVTGVLAREQGALVPARQVSSAKSWLSYPGVNRRAKILPAQAEPPQPMISPVEASARYLMHLRDAWNGAFGTDPDVRFEQQEIVLTVPASFDEEARELTVEAARSAGLEKLTLLEEPLAAFYAWLDATRHTTANTRPSSRGSEDLRDGELILICDIGGGTTDFSLVRAHSIDGELQFERTAIGEHVLLGGDNLDLALARRVEEKLNEVKLTLRQRYALRRVCCAAKERLLSDSSVERVPVTVLGSGRSVVGQTLSVDLSRDDVLQIVEAGFLPIVAPDEMPVRGRQTGLRELGLPYAADPAITKHLAAFLTQASASMSEPEGQPMVRPDAVLFNGGFCVPAAIRERIVDAISTWFGGAHSAWRPKLLNNEAADTAVARGAAYYGRVRRGAGLRVRVGSARTYYIGLSSDDSLQGICVLPAGVEEGTTMPLLNREFTVLANRPVSFVLLSSRVQHAAQGEVDNLDAATVHRHAPLVSLLRYGKKMREIYLVVRIRATFTEVGTLELWCEARDTPHRWRLRFELRGEETQAQQNENPRSTTPHSSAIASVDTRVESSAQLIRGIFDNSTSDASATETLVGRMEETLGAKRDSWPIEVLRRLADLLIETAAGRKISPRHELRWLNLTGLCLRPGFGAPGDDMRIGGLRTLASGELIFADDLQCQIEELVMLRRISGGINSSKQQQLYRRHMNAADKKKGRGNRQKEYESWRLVVSLEHLFSTSRAALGHQLLAKIRKDPEDAIWLWSLGRLGSRIPLYGPLHSVVQPEIAGEWLRVLVELPNITAAAASAIVMLARRTDDSSRDIDEALREQAISRLTELGTDESAIQLMSKYVQPRLADAARSFGESLPPGLQVVSSSNCLLSLSALRSARPNVFKPA
jgi:molecular chaperone DnaK (HSP70)